MQGERPSPRHRSGRPSALAIAADHRLRGLHSGFKFRGTTAAELPPDDRGEQGPQRPLRRVRQPASPRCYDDEAQKARAAQVLVGKLQRGPRADRDPGRDLPDPGRCSGRPEAREAILAATNDDDALVRAEACRALGRVGRPEDATVLARVMTLDVSAECRVAAIESLGDLKSQDRRITEYLVAGMEHDEPAIRVACLNALKSITGKDLGVDAVAWKKYVDALPDDRPGRARLGPARSPPPRPPAERPPEIP